MSEGYRAAATTKNPELPKGGSGTAPARGRLVTVDVSRCQRCGLDHPALPFLRLENPADEFAFYATCPATGQPVLLKVVQS